MFDLRVVYRHHWRGVFSGGFHRDRYRKSERRTHQSGFTDFAGIEFADYIDVVHGFFLSRLDVTCEFF